MDQDEAYMNYSDTELSEDDIMGDDDDQERTFRPRRPTGTTTTEDEDDDDLGIALVDEPTAAQINKQRDGTSGTDEFQQEVLSQDEIVSHMNDIIHEVTGVMQVHFLIGNTFTRHAVFIFEI